eukprot:COSAG02_NODE_873_length_16302_cov_113.473616_15_plen_884_part_00
MMAPPDAPGWAVALGLLLSFNIGLAMFSLQSARHSTVPTGCDCDSAAVAEIVEDITSRRFEDLERRIARSESRSNHTATSGSVNNTHPTSRVPRKLQRAGDDGQARPRAVHIYTATLTTHGNAPAAPSRGRRRAQARACDFGLLPSRMAEVSAHCCDEPGEDCSGPGGVPTSCNQDCATVTHQFWQDCETELDKHLRASFHDLVRQCQDAEVERAGFSDAHQLQLTCNDASATTTCIPTCNADLHGDLLLANIDGEDSKYSCELHHTLYSWIGGGSDGGYLGEDAVAFLSSLLSGAPGAYRLIVTRDADISTNVVIKPGMDVHIVGSIALESLPSWGSGSFSVGNRARLSLARLYLDLNAVIQVEPGGDVSLAYMSLHTGQLDWSETAGSTLILSNMQFAAPAVTSGDECNGGKRIVPTGAGGSGTVEWLFEDGTQTPSDDDLRDPEHNDYIFPLVECDSGWCSVHPPYCSWTIACAGATVEFIEFETENLADFVRVNDSPNWLSGNLDDQGIGTEHYPTVYTANQLDQETTIGFYPDRNIGRRGFRALWSCPGGDVIDQSYTVGDDGHTLTNATDGALAWQCYEPYTALRTEPWRNAAELDRRSPLEIPELPFSEGRLYCDADAEIGRTSSAFSDVIERQVYSHSPIDNQWLRLAGDAGDTIASHPPPLYAIESGPPSAFLFPVWMSGWDPHEGHPTRHYETEGRLPRTVDGVKPVTMCLKGLGGPCTADWKAVVVNCGEYFLWKLPMVPTCPAFYATTASGLPRANDIASTGTDCVGHHRECTHACERASARAWVQYGAPTGFGLPCPPAADCHIGDGACGLDTHTDCDGHWSECSMVCERAAERSWIEYVAPSAGGQPCPTATDCQDGEGACSYRSGGGH